MNDDLKMSVFQESVKVLSQQLREAAVDHEAFEKSLPVCDLVRCRATCCHDGVILSEEEGQVLGGLGGSGGIYRDPVGKLRTRTAEASSEHLATDFPEHFPKTRCVFLDENHHCQWQLKAVREGQHPWFYKPISCWLHPLLIVKRDGRFQLTIRSRAEDRRGFASYTPCGRSEKDGSPARQSLRMELEMLSRLSKRDFYAELNAPPGFSCST